MNPLRRFARGWRSFWFTPEATSTLALFRIAFGLVVTAWLATLGMTLSSFIGPDSALVDVPPLPPGGWTAFGVIGTGTVAVGVFWVASLAAALALTVGYRTRIASVAVFVALLSFERQFPLAVNGGDMLLRHLAFYLMLAPAGAALSVDRWRIAPDRFWESPRRSPWALRLMQIQLSVIYLSTVWEKMQGNLWRNGTATSFALRLEDLGRFDAPSFVTDSLGLVQMMTFGTLALEVAIGVLVWNRAARPWVLGLGVVMHLTIDLTIAVGFFSAAILVLYLVFLPPERASSLVDALRRRVGTRTASPRVPVPSDEAPVPRPRRAPRTDIHPPVREKSSTPSSSVDTRAGIQG